MARNRESGRTKPLYVRLLLLRHITLSGWQRALFVEGAIVCGVLLALAGVASAWSILILPVVVALGVKAHDVLAGRIERTGRVRT